MSEAERIVHLDEQGRVAISDILQGVKPGDPVVVTVTATGRLQIRPVAEPDRPWDAVERCFGILKDRSGAEEVLRSRDEEDRHE